MKDKRVQVRLDIEQMFSASIFLSKDLQSTVLIEPYDLSRTGMKFKALAEVELVKDQEVQAILHAVRWNDVSLRLNLKIKWVDGDLYGAEIIDFNNKSLEVLDCICALLQKGALPDDFDDAIAHQLGKTKN
tara:strand:- start:515 stop:907 length:393 start_codon:yes stop_codon:yes gene_type:complete